MKLIKILLLSLVISFSPLIFQTIGADTFSGKVVEISDTDKSKILFREKVLSDSTFIELFEQYKHADFTTDVSTLQDRMREIFQRQYYSVCLSSTPAISPFIPGGILGFLAPSNPTYLFVAGLKADREFDCIHVQEVSPTPPVHPKKIFEMIHAVLLPKYQGASAASFKQSTPVLTDEDYDEALGFMLTHKSDISLIGDPALFVTAFRLLCPLPDMTSSIVGPFVGQNNYSGSQVYPSWMGSSGSHRFPSFLQTCGGIIDGKLVTQFEQFYNALIMRITPFYQHHFPSPVPALEAVQGIKKETTAQLNSYFYVDGRQRFDIERDGRLLDTNIAKWFNILHKLAHLELQHWEVASPLLEQFLRQYKYAASVLDQKTEGHYSGLAVGPYSVLLVTPSSKENTVTHAALKQALEKHYENHMAEVELYMSIKPHLSTLRKTVAWLKDVFDLISKTGRVS